MDNAEIIGTLRDIQEAIGSSYYDDGGLINAVEANTRALDNIAGILEEVVSELRNGNNAELQYIGDQLAEMKREKREWKKRRVDN